MVARIIIPDLAKVKKRKGYVHEDIKVSAALYPFYDGFKSWQRHNLVEGLFLGYFDQDDATYRRDFLGEWLQNKDARTHLNSLYSALPSRFPEEVITEDSHGTLTDESIREQIKLIKKYLQIPETLESMSITPGSGEAIRDLKAFGKRTRKKLNDYARFVGRFKQDPQFRNNSCLDYNWANNCLEEIGHFLSILEEVRQIRSELNNYRLLCIPYEFQFKGKRIPSCKPVFLDPEKRTGTIRNAYHPAHFKFKTVYEGRRRRIILSKLNVPNNINWGPDRRNNFIIGPNDMGKSVYIDTIGLNVHLAMAGVFCFAESCELSLPRRIFPCFDLGDTLSSGHFVTGGMKVSRMLDNLSENDLVLLDEVAGGTEPDAEQKIAIGITDGLIDHRVTFFCATHYRESWHKHIAEPGIKTLRVADYDDEKRKHKVWEGRARRGYGIRKAQEMHIDPISVRKRLKQRLGRLKTK